MKRLTLVLLAQFMLAGAAPLAWSNEWENRGGKLNPAGGWFQWVQNTFDGRYCALGYGGSLQCYDPSTNVLETVYVDGSQTPDPQNGDLQIFGWDHVNLEYLAMDGGTDDRPKSDGFQHGHSDVADPNQLRLRWSRIANRCFVRRIGDFARSRPVRRVRRIAPWLPRPENAHLRPSKPYIH